MNWNRRLITAAIVNLLIPVAELFHVVAAVYFWTLNWNDEIQEKSRDSTIQIFELMYDSLFILTMNIRVIVGAIEFDSTRETRLQWMTVDLKLTYDQMGSEIWK